MNMTKELSESLLAACKAVGIEKPRYIAQNEDGQVTHHDERPSREGWLYIWGSGGWPKRLNHPPYADDWKDSLLEWVDHVADTNKKVDDDCKIAYKAMMQEADHWIGCPQICERAWRAEHYERR